VLHFRSAYRRAWVAEPGPRKGLGLPNFISVGTGPPLLNFEFCLKRFK